MTKKEVGLIVKSNALVEASYRLTPAEQGIILSCISQIRKDDKVTDQTMYRVPVATYVELTGTDQRVAYRDMKDAALRLRGREVRLYSLPNNGGRIKNKQRMRVAGWVQTIEYSDDEGEVLLRFNHDMLPYLTNISNSFTKYNQENVAKMSSSFGIRLYEIIIGWRSKHKTNKFEVSIDWLRRALMLEDKYPRMHDLKKRVLDPAMKDINKHSDLQVGWTQRKTGRRVTHLEFSFKSKKESLTESQSKQKSLESWKSRIEKHARPGETYNQASARLKEKKNKAEIA